MKCNLLVALPMCDLFIVVASGDGAESADPWWRHGGCRCRRFGKKYIIWTLNNLHVSNACK